MTGADRQFFRDWFNRYVSRYYGQNPAYDRNFKLKEDHSLRVCDNTFEIISGDEVETDSVYLAEVCALFHDIGRFEQLRKFGTFNDKLSVNHAHLGSEILESEAILLRLSEPERDIIIRAVRDHNLQNLPGDYDNPEVFFQCRLLRDADKLDILNVLSRHYTSFLSGSDSVLDLNLPDEAVFSPGVIEDIFNSKSVDFRKLRTLNDFKLAQLSWVFDLNFPRSLQLLKERAYLTAIISTLPENSVTAGVFNHINNYLQSTD